MRWIKGERRRTWAVVMLVATGVQALGPAAVGPGVALGHGGGGGHMGGYGGGGHMGGYGGGMGGMSGARGMPTGGFDGGRSFDGGRGFDGGRSFDGGRGFDDGRGFDGGRPIDGGRDFDGGRPIDGGRGLDGGRPIDGGRFDGDRGLDGGGRVDGFRDAGAGHFAGAGELSRTDFQRIAAGGVGGVGVGVGRAAVRPYSMNRLADRGNAIRRNVQARDWYANRAWYGQHFNAWWPGGWWGGFGWGMGVGMGVGMFTGLAWGDLARWGGYGAAPVAYDYGTTVQYQNDGVYVQGALVGTPEVYAAQATSIATAGGADVPVPADDQWRSLGVFALTRAEESDPNAFINLAIDQAGLLRGTYYDAVADATQKVTGKVDKKSQRAAWTIGDRTTPVYETGLANLTKDQSTVLVHRDGGKVEQMLLVRVPAPPQGGAAGAPAAAAGAAGTP